jgi:hypothetical protein
VFLSRRPSTTSERFRRRGTFCGLDKEFRNMHGQCLGQSIQDIDSRVLLSSLQTSDIRSVNAGIESQLLLRKAAFHPNPTQIPGHQSSSIHELRRTFWWLLNHWLYPVYYVSYDSESRCPAKPVHQWKKWFCPSGERCGCCCPGMDPWFGSQRERN